MAEKRLKRRRVEPSLLQTERDVEAIQGDSLEAENTKPLERWQFNPRTNKHVCQYCGFHHRKVGVVDRHVNTQHEMISWYKCELCCQSYLGHVSVYRHLNLVHHTKEKKFEKIIDEKEIEALRKSVAERPVKKRRDELNLLNAEKDAETARRDSSLPENTAPLQRCQFKPRINKYVCQYCGFHNRLHNNVDKHVNAQHEMTTWYKCKVCQQSYVNRSTLYRHLQKIHHTSEKKFEILKDEKEIEDLRKSMIEKRMKRRTDELNLFQIDKDAEAIQGNSSESQNVKHLERVQFKPRTNKFVCQYCGFHSRKISTVDRHVNSHHEMTTWYKCKLCHFSSVDHSTVYSHLKRVHHTTEKMFELISDEEEIEALRKSRAASRMKRRRDKLNFLNIEKDAETAHKDSSDPKYITPLERWQFKPRTNRYVCQYCGYHCIRVREVDQHVNTQHEMTSWFKCKLCHQSCLTHVLAYSHLKTVHHTKEKQFEMINDEEEIEALRKSRAQNCMKRRRDKLNLLNIEKDAETVFRDSSVPKNITLLERWQFKPRTSKYVCQYCGFHDRKVTNVNNHVNAQHEMTTWFKCQLCQRSFLGHQKIYGHFREEHHAIGVKFKLIKDEKEIEALRMSMADKQMTGGRVDPKILKAENDVETGNSDVPKNSTCHGALENDLSCNSTGFRSMTADGQGSPVIKSDGTSNNDFVDIHETDNKATKMESIKEEILEIEEDQLELYNLGESTQIAKNFTCRGALEDDPSRNSIDDGSMSAVVQSYSVIKSDGTPNNDFVDMDGTDNKATKMESIKGEILEIEEHPLELNEAGASTQNPDDLDVKWSVGLT